MKAEIKALGEFYQQEFSKLDESSSPELLNTAISVIVDRINPLLEKASTIGAYIHSFISTDSFNQAAMRLNSQFELVMVEISQVNVMLESRLGRLRAVLPSALELGGSAGEHAFPLLEIAEQSQFLMSEEKETFNELIFRG